MGSTIGTNIATLDQIAAEMQVRKDEAVAMNASGVNPMGDSGMVCYYLPEGVADTVTNVTAYNSSSVAGAEQSAADLQKAMETGYDSSGRTLDEVLAEISRHYDIPAYGTALIRTIGAEVMFEAPLLVSDESSFETIMEVFGHLLCSASQGYQPPPEGGTASSADASVDLSTLIASAVNDPEHPGRAMLLDAYMNHPSLSDGEPVLAFGTEFLLQLASSFGTSGQWPGAPMHPDPRLTDCAADPLAAVVGAMANNPEAALTFLAPTDATGYGEGVVEGQTGMDVVRAAGWENDPTELERLAGAFAAVAPLRHPSENEDTSAQQRANWVTGQAVEYMAVNVPSKDLMSEDTKESLSVVLANCAEEVQETALGRPVDGLPGVSPDELGTSLYRVMDDPDAAATVSAAVRDHAISSAQDGDPENVSSTELKDAYENLSTDLGFLQAVADERAADETAQSEADAAADTAASRESSSAAVSVITTIVTSGLSAVGVGPAGTLAWNLASNYTKPLAVEAVSAEVGFDVTASPSIASADLLQASAYADAANADLLGAKPPDLAMATDDRGWQHQWTDERGGIHLGSQPNPAIVRAVHGWAQDTGSDLVREIDYVITTGLAMAERRVDDSEPTTGGDEYAVRIDRS